MTIQSNPVQSKTRFRAASIFGLRFFFLSLSQCNWYTKQMNRCCWAEWVTEREREYITIAIVWCVKSLTLWCRSITNPCCFLLLFVFPLNRLINNSIIITNAERQVQSDLLLVVGFFSSTRFICSLFFCCCSLWFDIECSCRYHVKFEWANIFLLLFMLAACLICVIIWNGEGGARSVEWPRKRDRGIKQEIRQLCNSCKPANAIQLKLILLWFVWESELELELTVIPHSNTPCNKINK